MWTKIGYVVMTRVPWSIITVGWLVASLSFGLHYFSA